MSDFKCQECGADKEEELFHFTKYGNNDKKKKDEKWYCIKCFEEKEREYDM